MFSSVATNNLNSFLKDNVVEKDSKIYNFIDQNTGHKFYFTDEPWVIPENLDHNGNLKFLVHSKLDYFMYLLQECYKISATQKISEMQYYNHKVAESEMPSITEDIGEAEKTVDTRTDQELEEEKFLERTISESLAEKSAKILDEVIGKETVSKVLITRVEKSCTEWDFDIYQKTKDQIFTESKMQSLIRILSAETVKILDLEKITDPAHTFYYNQQNWIKFHVAHLAKTENIQVTDVGKIEKYKTNICFKCSFRVRIYIMLSKGAKILIRKNILKNQEFLQIMRNENILNSPEDILDAGPLSSTIMMLGSVARNKDPKRFSDLKKVYIVKTLKENTTSAYIGELEEEQNVGIFYITPEKDPNKKGKKSETVRPQIRGNLVYELSVSQQSPTGIIRKPIFDIRAEYISEVKLTSEVFSIETQNHGSELSRIREQISNLAVMDYRVRYLNDLIMCLKQDRSRDYNQWRQVVMSLASLGNPDYYPLAELFSIRCPELYVANNPDLRKIWDSVKLHTNTDYQKYLRILSTWAKTENPVLFEQANKQNIFHKLLQAIIEYPAKFSDMVYAEIIKIVFGDLMFSYIDRTGKTCWAAFRLVEEDEMDIASFYKWYKLEERPQRLIQYLTTDLIDELRALKRYIESKAAELEEGRDETRKALLRQIAGISSSMHSLEMSTSWTGILRAADAKLRKENMVIMLDHPKLYENILGVRNGVLELGPDPKLIQNHHNYYITKSTSCNYTPYNPNNPLHKEVESRIAELFVEKDAMDCMMILLASSLSGKSKVPARLILGLGEGGNGKTFLFELHTNTLKAVSDPIHSGYTNNVGLQFLTEGFKSSAPDTQLMSSESARFIYVPEGYQGMIIRMENVKKLTDKIGGNEKFEKHKVIKINSDIWLISNFNCSIPSRDHGSWRRVVAYNFKKKFSLNPDPNDPLSLKEDPTLMTQHVGNKEYQSAYLAILVKYYQVYEKKYGGDIAKVLADSPTVMLETENYRQSQDYVYRFYRTNLIVVDPLEETVDPISFNTIQTELTVWCNANQIRPTIDDDMKYLKKIVKAHLLDPKSEVPDLMNHRFIKDVKKSHSSSQEKAEKKIIEMLIDDLD